MNIKQALHVQAALDGKCIPSDLAVALDEVCRVTSTGKAIMLKDMNLIHIIRAYLKEQNNG
jgi:hypothetical protein|tara:strand:- start:5992 stop:6174 length:183 start_codon:yes stop_codon:yes gene_type:complete